MGVGRPAAFGLDASAKDPQHQTGLGIGLPSTGVQWGLPVVLVARELRPISWREVRTPSAGYPGQGMDRGARARAAIWPSSGRSAGRLVERFLSMARRL